MKHLTSYVITVLVIIAAALVASCGASTIGASQNVPAVDGQDNGVAVDNQFDPAQLPAFPAEEQAAEPESHQAKSVSVVTHPNHLAPFASLNGGIDPGDPNCFLLKGYKGGVPGAPKDPQIAYAMYKIHLGAMEPLLLDMKVAAQVGSAGEQYYAAIANWSALHWQFYGPYNAPSWDTDMTSLGYDFTSGAGDLYIVLIALPGQSLHITDITLNFKDREKPKVWNVWGQAFESYATGSAHGGFDVIFTDIHTGVNYVTLTAADGKWGMNLPTGEYNFEVIGNEMLLDVSGPVAVIDYLPAGVGTRLDLDSSGQIVYQGSNAVYTGSVVPMPLITANSF